MRKLEQDQSWVIYQAVNKGVVCGPNAVCELAEWEAMERARPGAQSVVQMGIATEGLAERLARGTSGDSAPRAGLKAAAGVDPLPGPGLARAYPGRLP